MFVTGSEESAQERCLKVRGRGAEMIRCTKATAPIRRRIVFINRWELKTFLSRRSMNERYKCFANQILGDLEKNVG